MIESFQAVRGFAALAVVFYHFDIPLPNGVHTDFNAVAIFFVLSGFLMAYTTERSTELFLLKRLLRVAPTYWTITLVSAVLYALGAGNPLYSIPVYWNFIAHNITYIPTYLHEIFSAYFNQNEMILISKSMLFFPRTDNYAPLIGVGWTLNIELVCYAALWLYKRLFPDRPVMMLALALYASANAILVASPVSSLSENVSYIPYFAGGLVLFYANKKLLESVDLGPRMWLALSCISLLYFIAVSFDSRHSFILTTWLVASLWPIGAASALVMSALCLYNSGFDKRVSGINFVGNMSFSLYLVHAQILEMLKTLWPSWPSINPHDSVFGFVFTMSMCLAGGAIAYVAIERPLTELGHQAVSRLQRHRNEAFVRGENHGLTQSQSGRLA